MTLLYQKIKIPNFDIKQQELIELATGKFQDSNLLTYYDPSREELENQCPTLYSFLCKNSKVPIRFFRLYHTPPLAGLPPHIDGNVHYRSPIGLNLPILNCTNALMKWWDESNADLVTGNFGWNDIPATRILNNGQLRCIERVEINNPTFVRTDFIHSIENYNNQPRVIMSIRWKFNKLQGQQFKDVLDYDIGSDKEPINIS
jgi:hypothetical protein